MLVPATLPPLDLAQIEAATSDMLEQANAVKVFGAEARPRVCRDGRTRYDVPLREVGSLLNRLIVFNHQMAQRIATLEAERVSQAGSL